jgi:hypothetical protein
VDFRGARDLTRGLGGKAVRKRGDDSLPHWGWPAGESSAGSSACTEPAGVVTLLDVSRHASTNLRSDAAPCSEC